MKKIAFNPCFISTFSDSLARFDEFLGLPK